MSRQAMVSPPYQQSIPAMVVATLWVYKCLLALQPPAFRREFAAPITQVFRQTCLDAYRSAGIAGLVRLWPRAAADVVYGALAEYSALLLQGLKGSPNMDQYRRSASIIFAAFIAFVVAGIGFNRISEDTMKSALPAEHPLLAIAYGAMVIGALIAVAAVLIGGLPVAFAALRYALSHRRLDILSRFLAPPVALAALVASVVVVARFDIGGNTLATIHSPARIAGAGVVVAIFILGAIASTAAVLDAIARSEIDGHLLRFTLLPGSLAIVAMVDMVVAFALWSFSLWHDAPSLFWGNEGILATSTVVSLLAQVILMVGATAIATRAAVRGFAARRTAPHLA